MLFALNLKLQPGEDLSAISADAEDQSHRHYDLRVESIGPVRGQSWMSSLTLRLSDELSDVGDVLIRITYQGQASNRVRLGIGHLGDGPPDDPDARPTSPYLLRGRVITDGAGLANVLVTLQGNSSTVRAVTNTTGEYLIATVAGDYVLSASQAFFEFDPATLTFSNLSRAFDGLNFLGNRKKRRISGVARDDLGRFVPGVEVTLTSNDSPARSTTTDDSGSFSFNEVPAGLSYTVAPSHNIFTFAPQAIEELGDNTALTFSGVRRDYTVSGHVTEGGAGVPNAILKLQPTEATTVSDAFGNYSFAGVKAGFDYTILVQKEDYEFNAAGFSVPRLDGNRQLDLEGRPHVFLTGRVLDASGRGVFGVKINVSGTQTGVTTTTADGSYSFLVTAFGTYTLRPWEEQDYYSYSPGTASLTTQEGSRNAEFRATLNASVSPSQVLEFDGSPKSVDYSMTLPGPDYNLFFWNDGLPMGHFFWEFWAMPAGNAAGTYIISDGYGGAHAILFGVGSLSGRERNRYQLIGNIWNGSTLTSFASDEGPAPNEWGHFGVGWDGTNIVTYFNGVPVGKTFWVGPRITPGGLQGTGRLLIGGSDHSNFAGRIAQMRGYEENNPLETAGTVFATFAPQTVFTVDGNVLSYFFRPGESAADLSPFGHRGRNHPGLLRGTLHGVVFPCAGCPLPRFVVDPTAPDFSHPNNPGSPPTPIDPSPPVPSGALAFDSFSRRNSTYALGGAGGLEATEAGLMGRLTWQTSQPSDQLQPFGILNGRAVLLANSTAVAWTSIPGINSDLDVGVDRHAGFWGAGNNTGLSFRVVDSNNYFFTYSSDGDDPSQPQRLTVGYYLSGVRSELTTAVSMPTAWTTLRVVTMRGGKIAVYADSTLLYSTTNNVLVGSTGVGIYNNAAGLALTNRWDNFRVFRAS